MGECLEMKDEQVKQVMQLISDVESKVSWVDKNTENLDSKLDKIIQLLEQIVENR